MSRITIHSRFFISDFQTDENTPMISSPNNVHKKHKSWSPVGLGLTIAISCILVLLIISLVICFLRFMNKRKNRYDQGKGSSEVDNRRGEIEAASVRNGDETESLGVQNQIGSREDSRAESSSHIQNQLDNEFELVAGARKIALEVLAQATNGFSGDRILGRGGFGVVYEGFFILNDKEIHVAVKKVSKGGDQGMREYEAEVIAISQLRHKNLVRLIGWCHEKDELLLVYEYMENGSLDSHLIDEDKHLTWVQRFQMAQGLASALYNLHEQYDKRVLHMDIKSSNVMLDEKFNAKLGDFGLAQLVDHEAGSQLLLGGTLAYLAPECIDRQKFSAESDVYSLGVVLLEIACGRGPLVRRDNGSQVRLAKWVWEFYEKQKILETADPKLGGEFNRIQMECLMIVGLWCAHPDHCLRPSARKAMIVLHFDAPLPNLPSKYPDGTAHSPAMCTQGLLEEFYTVNSTFNAAETQQPSYASSSKSSTFFTLSPESLNFHNS